MNKTVSNTTPIISLACIDQLPLMEKLFGKIYLPEAVYNEITVHRYPGYKDLSGGMFEVVSVKNSAYLDLLLNELDAGEAESIVIAKELPASTLIIDERIGYKIANTQGVYTIGTLTVLLMAKNKGIIQKVQPLLHSMIEKGRWYSPRIYHQFLKSIGEI